MQYAKFHNVEQVIRDEKSGVQSVCREELLKNHVSHITAFLAIAVIVPWIAFFCFSFCLQNSHERIEKVLFKSTNEDNYPAFLLTSLYTSLYIIIMDCIAVHKTNNNHEFKGIDGVQQSFAVRVTYATLAFDLFFQAISVLICIISYCIASKRNSVKKICCNNEACNCILCCMHCSMLGYKRSQVLSGYSCPKNEDNEDGLYPFKMWSLFILFFGTLCCVSSHIGYVLVAWLTEPDKTTYTALFMIAVLLYLFLILRKIYGNFFKFFDFCKKCRDTNNTKSEEEGHHDANNESNPLLPNGEQKLLDTSHYQIENDFNCGYFVLIFLVGLPAVLPVIAIYFALSSLPIPVMEIAVYVENITQIVFVLAAVLVSYKVLEIKESDTKRFLNELVYKFKELRSGGHKRDHSPKHGRNCASADGNTGDQPGNSADGNTGDQPGNSADGNTGDQPGNSADGNTGDQPGNSADGNTGDQSGNSADGNTGDQPGNSADGNTGDQPGNSADGNTGDQPGNSADGNTGDQPGNSADGNTGDQPGNSADGNTGDQPGNSADGNTGDQPNINRSSGGTNGISSVALLPGNHSVNADYGSIDISRNTANGNNPSNKMDVYEESGRITGELFSVVVQKLEKS